MHGNPGRKVESFLEKKICHTIQHEITPRDHGPLCCNNEVGLAIARSTDNLLVRKSGLPLLGESRHAFLLVLGSKEALEEASFEAGSLLQAEFEGCYARHTTAVPS